MKTLKQLAKLLGILPDSLRQRIARGTLKAKKHGRDWMVSEQTVKKLLKEKGLL